MNTVTAILPDQCNRDTTQNNRTKHNTEERVENKNESKTEDEKR